MSAKSLSLEISSYNLVLTTVPCNCLQELYQSYVSVDFLDLEWLLISGLGGEMFTHVGFAELGEHRHSLSAISGNRCIVDKLGPHEHRTAVGRF